MKSFAQNILNHINNSYFFSLNSEKIITYNYQIDLFIDNMNNYMWDDSDIFINPNKETIVIIDDNEGICSFLKDDFLNILGDDYKNYNILTFHSTMAAYNLISCLEKNNIQVKYAIIDLFLNGVFKTYEKNIRLTGVDVFEYLYKKFNIKNYLFYTGNQLNSEVKTIKNILDQYKKLTDDNLENKTIFKTSLNIEERQQILKTRVLKC